MNILILNWRDINNPKSGGAEIVTMEHAKAWKKAGHNVFWFTSNFKGAKRNDSIEGINIKRFGNFITVYLFAPMYYLLSRQKFDIVIDQIHGLPFFTPLYVRKPKIAFIHEVAGEIWDYMYPFPINKIGKITERFMFFPYRKVQFITVSSSTAKELKKYGIGKIKVIKNGIKYPKLKKLKKETSPTFIFISRLVKMKGIEDVIEAFFLINVKIDKSKLWIIGEGEQGYVKSLISKYNLSSNKNIKLLGYISENKKFEMLKRAHILLHASIKEGWGLVVIEAASQDTPSIVYNVSGLRDSVINNKTGIVLNNNNSSEMAEAAIDLLENNNKYKKFQNECFKWAEGLTWRKSTKESLKLLENTTNK